MRGFNLFSMFFDDEEEYGGISIGTFVVGEELRSFFAVYWTDEGLAAIDLFWLNIYTAEEE